MTPRERCIFDEVEVETMEDPTFIESVHAEDVGVEVDELEPSPFAT